MGLEQRRALGCVEPVVRPLEGGGDDGIEGLPLVGEVVLGPVVRRPASKIGWSTPSAQNARKPVGNDGRRGAERWRDVGEPGQPPEDGPMREETQRLPKMAMVSGNNPVVGRAESDPGRRLVADWGTGVPTTRSDPTRCPGRRRGPACRTCRT